MTTRVGCSVVVPQFNEAPNLQALCERLARVLDAEALTWEVIIVDDGSTDGSYELAARIHDTDHRFKCLSLSRNFGSHVAITAGLEHAMGEVAIVITADLQEPPELIPEFLAKWREGYSLVWGLRRSRTETSLDRMGSRLFHRLFHLLTPASGDKDEEIGGGFFLADRKVLDALSRFGERNRNIVALLQWSGYRYGRVHYDPAPRIAGRSKWTFSMKVRHALDSIVGFSRKPLQAVFFIGLSAFGVGLLALFAALLSSLFSSSGAAVVILVLSVILLMGGLQLAAIGLLGEYLWGALEEARGRPLYLVMDKVGWEDGEGADVDA